MARRILGRMTVLAVLCAACAFAAGCKTAPDSKAALAQMTAKLVSSLPPGLDADAALASLDRAIAASPDSAMCYSNRATVYRDAKKDYPRALADYDKAIELAPGLSQVYVNRGMARQLAGDPALAREDYSKAIALDPKNALAFCRRGDLDRADHQDDLGIADYTAAIALDPRRAEAFCGRGMPYARAARYDLALAGLQQGHQAEPARLHRVPRARAGVPGGKDRPGPGACGHEPRDQGGSRTAPSARGQGAHPASSSAAAARRWRNIARWSSSPRRPRRRSSSGRRSGSPPSKTWRNSGGPRRARISSWRSPKAL